MVIRMRATRGHTNNRRSHHALRGVGTAKCAKCGADALPHTVCENCGFYKGREVLDVLKKLTKKEKKQKAKELKEQEAAAETNKPLDAATLSKKS